MTVLVPEVKSRVVTVEAGAPHAKKIAATAEAITRITKFLLKTS
jgi:hypothetical protein